MYILGLSCFYHDSSACLLKEGKVIAAAQEERFTRVKHDTSFPLNASKWCMESAGITIDDVDYVAFYEKPFRKFERVLYQHLESFPWSWRMFCGSMPSWLNEKLRMPRILRKKLRYRGEVFFIDHHMCHAASSFLASPFREAALLTIDGVGEYTTTALGHAKGNDITLEKHITFPHSLGLLYSAVTAYLGFKVNNSEYKVMGLSAYGNNDRKTNDHYRKMVSDVIDMKDDGSFALNMDYFDYVGRMRMFSGKFVRDFGSPRKPGESITPRHKDIAAAVQMVTEDVVLHLLGHLRKTTGLEGVCLAGGVALNSVVNGKILKGTGFRRIFIQPAAGDAGTSVGAALYLYNTILGKKRSYVMESAYLGPGYSMEEIKKFLDGNSIKYTEFRTESELLKKTARLIAEDKVVGWFQGRMEWGPRALGNRSILANPKNPGMQDILNLKVKHREKFRPFAPAVCADDAYRYFECDRPLPAPADFMLMVYPMKSSRKGEIPAVVHADGTGRLQTLRKEQNPLYYKLIKEFGRLTGTPVLINTSFNIRGEPIVMSPYDAYRCMMGTGIDYLVIDRFLIRREDNRREEWDSEKYSRDGD